MQIKDVIDIVDATSSTLSGSSFDNVNLSGTVFNNVNLDGTCPAGRSMTSILPD